MNATLRLGLAAAVVVMIGATGIGGPNAQISAAPQPPTGGPTAADRSKVLEALGKGDVAAAEKIMSELQAQVPAAPPGVAAPFAGGSVFYEELKACGFYPQETRLACVIEIKRQSGYSSSGAPGVGNFGTMEHVYFCIDWNGSNTYTQLESAGQGSVQMHDEGPHPATPPLPAVGPFQPPWHYAVYRDFPPPGVFRTLASGGMAFTATSARTVHVKGIFSWHFAPTGCNYVPVWGNILVFPIRMDPIR